MLWNARSLEQGVRQIGKTSELLARAKLHCVVSLGVFPLTKSRSLSLEGLDVM